MASVWKNYLWVLVVCLSGDFLNYIAHCGLVNLCSWTLKRTHGRLQSFCELYVSSIQKMADVGIVQRIDESAGLMVLNCLDGRQRRSTKPMAFPLETGFVTEEDHSAVEEMMI